MTPQTLLGAACNRLHPIGLIRYVRGQLTVIDRRGLESASCDCYKAIRQVYAEVGIPF